MLAGASTLFWVPVLAYLCSALGAPAGLEFWTAFAVVMFVLALCMWAMLQSGMREAALSAPREASAAQVLRLNERRRDRGRIVEA